MENGIKFHPYWPYVIIRKWKPKDTAIKGGKIVLTDSTKDRMIFPHGTLVAVFSECPSDSDSGIWIHPKIVKLIGASQEEVENEDIHVFYGEYVGQEWNKGIMEGKVEDDKYDVVKCDQLFGEMEGEVY